MDRLHLRCKLNPVEEDAIGSFEWPNNGVTSLLGNRLEGYFENSDGIIGSDVAAHGPSAWPFDDALSIYMEGGAESQPDNERNYNELCDWLRFNPVEVSAVRISADKPETIKRLSVNVTRRTPFSKNTRQWVPLAGFLDQASENNSAIKVPMSFVLDGFTTFDVKASSNTTDAEYFDLIFEVSQVDDDRRHLA